MNYIYKTIPTFPNFEICDEAPMDRCIRTVDTKEYAYVHLDKHGYPRTCLGKRKGGDGKKHQVHHLVAETYIGNIPEGMVCDHIDTNKLNFNHNNLRICTQKENNNNLLTRKHMSEGHKKYFSNPENRQKHSNANNHRKIWIQQIDKVTGKVLNEYFGLREAERQTGYFRRSITLCCRGKRKTAYGYIWKYKE